jgi:hypothetical protein
MLACIYAVQAKPACCVCILSGTTRGPIFVCAMQADIHAVQAKPACLSNGVCAYFQVRHVDLLMCVHMQADIHAVQAKPVCSCVHTFKWCVCKLSGTTCGPAWGRAVPQIAAAQGGPGEQTCEGVGVRVHACVYLWVLVCVGVCACVGV